MEDFFWEVINMSEELNNVLIEIFFRYQFLVSEFCFVRLVFNVNYDLYRMMRYFLCIEVLFNFYGLEEQRDFVMEVMEIFFLWVIRGVEVLVLKREILVEEFFFIEFEFNEFWDFYVRMEIFYVMGILVYLEGFFNYMKNLFCLVVYYFLGFKGFEKMFILYIV